MATTYGLSKVAALMETEVGRALLSGPSGALIKTLIENEISPEDIGIEGSISIANVVDLQTELDGKQAVVAGVSDTEIGYLNGVTSSIQDQIDAAGSTILFARKTASENVVSSTTYQDDDHLVVTLTETGTYRFKLHLSCAMEATGGIKVKFLGPTFTSIKSTVAYLAGALVAHSSASGATMLAETMSIDDIQSDGILVVTDITTPTLKVQWAQNASDVGQTILNSNSHLEVWKVA